MRNLLVGHFTTVSLLTAVILLLAIVQGFAILPSVNADALYSLTFVSEILSGALPFIWIVQPANGFFPDVLIVLLGKILGFDLGGNFVFYSSVYYVVLFLSSIFFLRACGADTVNACIASVATLIVTTFNKLRLDEFSFVSGVPGHHAGVLPVALTVFGLMVQETAGTGSRSSRVLAGGLIAAVTFSDLIAVVQIVFPVVTLSIFLFWKGHQFRRNSATFVAYLIAGNILGLFAWYLSNHFWIQHGISRISLARFAEGWVDFLYLMPWVAWGLGLLHCLIVALGLILGAVFLAHDAVKRREWRPDTVGRNLLTLSAFAALVGPLAAGTSSEMDFHVIRQQLPAVFFPALWVCWSAVSLATDMFFPRWRRVLIALVLFSALGSFLQRVAQYPLDTSNFLNAYKSEAEELNGIGADIVLAEYWDAKPLHMVSRLPICGATSEGIVYAWITNLGWCDHAFDTWQRNRGTVLIGGYRSLPIEIIKVYGVPARRLEQGEGQFLLYTWSRQLQERISASICDAYNSASVQWAHCSR